MLGGARERVEELIGVDLVLGLVLLAQELMRGEQAERGHFEQQRMEEELASARSLARIAVETLAAAAAAVAVAVAAVDSVPCPYCRRTTRDRATRAQCSADCARTCSTRTSSRTC